MIDKKLKAKVKPRKLILNNEEYLITPESIDARHYKVFLKDKELKDVVGLIRYGGIQTE